MAIGSRNGKGSSGIENKAVIGREEFVQEDEFVREEIRREVKALVKRVAEDYSALQSLMEQNPWLAEEMDAEDRTRKRAFDDKLQKGLRRANDAPRCRWVKQGGTSCGSPQMRNHIYCYAHRQMMEAQALTLRMPAAEDANAIQVGLMRIQKALIDDTISAKKAGLLLYSMQLAITNVGRTTFGQANDDDLVMETVDEAEAIGSSGHREIGPSENQNLPRRNADERGLENERKEVEWRPTPEMYRMDTQEGIGAYEASFQMKIEPGERIPPEAEQDRSRVDSLSQQLRPTRYRGPSTRRHALRLLRLAQDDKGRRCR